MAIAKRGNRIASMAVLAVVSVLATILPALPAFALPTGSASMNVPEVLAGGSKEFRFTVSNTSPGNNTPVIGNPAEVINNVRIQVPLTGYDITSASGPSGWSPTIVRSGTPSRGRAVIFSGGTLTTGNNAEFTVNSAIPASATDKSGNWVVEASSDGGATSSQLTGALQTVIRVLEVGSLGITAPSGAIDNSVTGGQSGIRFETSITNHANTALNTVAELSDSGMRISEQATCPGAGSNPRILNPGETGSYCFLARFGSVSSQTVTTALMKASAGATATSGNAFNKTLAVTVQTAVNLAYVTDTLSPRAVRPGQTGVTFTLRANKTGGPGVCFDKAASELTFDGVTLDLASPDCIGAGSQSNQLITYQTLSAVPNLPRGNFDASINFVGTDDNSHGLSTGPISVGSIRIDIDPPTVEDVLATPPASLLPPEPRAAKDTSVVQLNAQVNDYNATTGQVDGCGPPRCSIESGSLLVYPELDGSGDVIETIDVKGRLTLGPTGAITGNYNGAYIKNPLGQSAQFCVKAKDDVGFEGADCSGIFEIDNIKPLIERVGTARASATNPVTQEETTVQNRLIVEFSERVGGTSTRFNWQLDGNTVVDVGPLTCDDGPRAKCRQMLTTLNEFPDDGPLPSITYNPGGTGGAPAYFDRVNNAMTTQEKDIVDLIAPFAPTIESVNGSAQQDGQFWTNQTEGTTVRLSGDRAVEPGYTAQVLLDDGDGQLDDGDTKVGEKNVLGSDCTRETGSTNDICAVTVSLNLNGGLGNTSEDKRIFAVTLDTAPKANLSPPRVAIIGLDLVAPVVQAVTKVAGKVIVTFSEALPQGRDFQNDWYVANADGGAYGIQAVQQGATKAIREIVLAANSGYTPAAATELAFLFVGPAGTRYQDRATNELSDFVRAI